MEISELYHFKNHAALIAQSKPEMCETILEKLLNLVLVKHLDWLGHGVYTLTLSVDPTWATSAKLSFSHFS